MPPSGRTLLYRASANPATREPAATGAVGISSGCIGKDYEPRRQPMRRNYPTPATLIALIALVFAMTGAAAALPGHKSVKGDDLANNSVSSKAIKKNAVAAKQLKNQAVTT